MTKITKTLTAFFIFASGLNANVSYSELERNHPGEQATEVQWKAWAKQYEYEKMDFTGTVLEVGEKLFGGITVSVDANSDGIKDISFDVSEEKSLQLNKGQSYRIQGRIKSLTKSIMLNDVNIKLVNVSIGNPSSRGTQNIQRRIEQTAVPPHSVGMQMRAEEISDELRQNMKIIGERDGVISLRISSSAESCTARVKNTKVLSSTCKKMINSKGVEIYCTPRKKMCKALWELVNLADDITDTDRASFKSQKSSSPRIQSAIHPKKEPKGLYIVKFYNPVTDSSQKYRVYCPTGMVRDISRKKWKKARSASREDRLRYNGEKIMRTVFDNVCR